MSGDAIIEEEADLPISSTASVSKVIEAGRAFVATRCPGPAPEVDRPKLLSVKPSNLRIPGRPY